MITQKDGNTDTDSSAELTSRMVASNDECGRIDHIHVARPDCVDHSKVDIAYTLGSPLKRGWNAYYRLRSIVDVQCTLSAKTYDWQHTDSIGEKLRMARKYMEFRTPHYAISYQIRMRRVRICMCLNSRGSAFFVQMRIG